MSGSTFNQKKRNREEFEKSNQIPSATVERGYKKLKANEEEPPTSNAALLPKKKPLVNFF